MHFVGSTLSGSQIQANIILYFIMIVVIFRKSIEHFDLIYLVMESDCILIFVLMREQL